MIAVERARTGGISSSAAESTGAVACGDIVKDKPS